MNPVDHLAGLRDIIGRGKSFRGRGSWANGPQNMGMNMQNNQHFGMNMQNYAPKYRRLEKRKNEKNSKMRITKK